MRHDEVKEVIVDHILHEGLACGDQIMSIPKFAKKLKTSDKTIQKAITTLKKDDVLYSINGKGNFVKKLEKVDKPSCLRVAVFDDETDKILKYFTSDDSLYKGNLKVIHKKFPPDSSIKDIINVYKADVILFDESNIGHLRSSDILELLASEDLPDFASSQLLKVCIHNHKVYATPLFFSPIVTIINRDLFDTLNIPIPSTWTFSKFKQIAKILSTQTRRKVIGVGITISPHRLPALFASFGAFPIRKDSLAKIEKTLAFIKKIISFDGANHTPLLKYQYFRLFEEGHMGMTFTSYNALRNASNIKFSWDLLPIPKAPNGNTCFVCTYGAISKSSKKKYYAKEFLKELTSAPVQTFLKKNYFLLPVNKQVCENESISPTEPPDHYHAYKNDLETMLPISDFFLSKKLQAEFEYQLTLFVNEIIDLKETSKSILKIFTQSH